MKSFVRLSWTTLCVLSLLHIRATTAAADEMVDPLFGLKYDTSRVKFEAAPERLLSRCPSLRESRLWIYGRARLGKTEYVILSGPARVPPDMASGAQSDLEHLEEMVGVVAKLNMNKCVLTDVETAIWGERGRSKKEESFQLAPSLLTEMSDDAINRYANAFGGTQKFYSELESAKVILENLPPALRQALLKSRRVRDGREERK